MKFCRVPVLAILAALFATATVTAPASAQWDLFQWAKPQKRQIEWHLENPFRLFTDPADLERQRRAFKALNFLERRTPVQSVERQLQRAAGAPGWAKSVYGKTCYDPVSQHYNKCRDYVLPKSHRVVIRVKGYPANTDICRFDLVGAKRERLKTFQAPCGKAHLIDIPYPAGATVEVRREDNLIGSRTIKVEDLLIVAFGDSIGSGEGNPDVPATLTDGKTFNYGRIFLARDGHYLPAFKPRELSGYPRRAGSWRKLFHKDFDKGRAKWLDSDCHRSLYSYQARVALQLALENNQRAVTFLSFACTGADTLNGIFLKSAGRECSAGKSANMQSQINAALHELCASAPMPVAIPSELNALMPELKNQKHVIQACRGNRLKRPVDLVLVSLGGNDIGFSQMVADAILSESSIYRRLAGQLNSIHGADIGAKKLRQLPRHYDALNFMLKSSLGIAPERENRIVVTSYPRMGYAEDGSVCQGRVGMEVFPPFSLRKQKVEKIEALGEGLDQVLKVKQRQFGWTLVDSYRETFRKHGICARQRWSPHTDEAMGFPVKTSKGEWFPFKPSEYLPYASRQRWIRTPNDVFLASNLHKAKLEQTGCWNLRPLVNNAFQIFLASTYGGSFHPTAEGHAVMADAALAKVRLLLAKKRHRAVASPQPAARPARPARPARLAR